MKRTLKYSLLLTLPLLAACAVGPDYQRPPVDTPVVYKESGDWQKAQSTFFASHWREHSESDASQGPVQASPGREPATCVGPFGSGAGAVFGGGS